MRLKHDSFRGVHGKDFAMGSHKGQELRCTKIVERRVHVVVNTTYIDIGLAALENMLKGMVMS